MLVATRHDSELSGRTTDIPSVRRDQMAEAVRRAAKAGTIDPGTWAVQQMALKHQHGLADGHLRVHLMARDSYTSYPQELADSIAMATQDAVQWFHDPSVTIQAVWTEAELTDDDVRERIKGYQLVMDREIARLSGHSYTEGWAWRLKPGWEKIHDEWIVSFNAYIDTPEGRETVLFQNVWRYDLSALPFPLQRSLVSQWLALREATDRPVTENGITVGDITLSFPKDSAPDVSGYSGEYWPWGPYGATWGMPHARGEE